MKAVTEKTLASGETLILKKVWELPVRIIHWTIVVCVVVLAITGYFIGNPPFSNTQDAATIFTFGTIRFLHFLFAYILLAAFIFRIYWGFVGNQYARWSTMLPFSGKKWKNIWREIKYLFWPRTKLPVYTGHSPLANLTYLLLYLVVLFGIVSGFTMYAAAQYTPFWRRIAAWGLALFGNNLNQVHFLHHFLLWIFAVFVILHLYMVVYTVVVSYTTEVDTMISGYKFVLKSELAEE